MKLNSIEIIAFFCIYLYNLFLINYCGKIVEFKINKRKALILFPIVMTLIHFSMLVKQVFLPIVYIVNFIIYMLIFKTTFKITLESAYILIICQIFQIVINRDIIVGIITLIYKRSMYQSIQNYKTYLFTCLFAYLLVLIVGTIFNKKVYIDRIKIILLYEKKIIINMLSITALIIILLNSNYTYYYSGDIKTTTLIMLSNGICIYFCFYFSIGMAFKSIKWVEEEVIYKTNLLNLEYNDKLNKKIDEYSNLLKMYNHDFKNILFNIKDSIEIGDIKTAKEIIYKFDEKIQTVTNYNKKLSNNSLINALMNRLYEECSCKNIYFDSDCYIPNKISISEIDLVNIFNNLSSNALEACIKQNKDEKKWISFKSYVRDNNLIIYQSNSFNGYIKFRKDKLITTKKNKKLHGIGVESIKYIVNAVNGIAFIKIDEENNIFKFLIKIPLSVDE